MRDFQQFSLFGQFLEIHLISYSDKTPNFRTHNGEINLDKFSATFRRNTE